MSSTHPSAGTSSAGTPAAVVTSGLTFAWPDGTPVLTGLDAAFGVGRTGLIGRNGAGKSTLLRLIAGDLRPQAGSVRVAGTLEYLPQQLPLRTGSTVSDLLGIAAARAALHAIERGEATEENYAVIGDDWDVEERARAELDRLGLHGVGLDRTVATLSGGETVLTGLAGRLLRRPAVLLLDEPTNNLDLTARRRLYDAVAAWRGVLIVVSHDRELLGMVDQIAELRDGGVRTFGGDLTAYEEALAVEQEAALRSVRSAETDLRRQRRELAEAHVKLARRERYGRKMYENKREPKVVMGMRKRSAQESAAKHRLLHEDRRDAARDRLEAARDRVRADAEIRISLPETEVPAGRTVLTVTGLRPAAPDAPGPDTTGPDGAGPDALTELIVRGPERIALTGPNGSGKTTLLREIAGERRPSHGTVRVGVAGVGYLPQRLDVLDEELSVFENVRARAPGTSGNRIRAGLARFLFRGERADLPAAALSGGERFRAVLATLLLADPAPQLLLLDEPTNNLDLDGVARLAQALAEYRGALIVAGHDLPFLESLGITRWLHLDPEAGLSQTFA